MKTQLGLVACCLVPILAIAFGGSTATAQPRHGAIVRFEFDGQPDLTFDGDGMIEVDLSGTGSEYFMAGARATASVAGIVTLQVAVAMLERTRGFCWRDLDPTTER